MPLCASGPSLHEAKHSRAQDQAGVCILHWGCGVQDEWQLPGAALLSKAEQMSEVPGELTPSGVCKAHQLFAGATLLLRYHSFDSCYQGCPKALLCQMLVLVLTQCHALPDPPQHKFCCILQRQILIGSLYMAQSTVWHHQMYQDLVQYAPASRHVVCQHVSVTADRAGCISGKTRG
jgi:hypothetical protein